MSDIQTVWQATRRQRRVVRRTWPDVLPLIALLLTLCAAQALMMTVADPSLGSLAVAAEGVALPSDR